jgi:hypothetical protein
MRVEEIKLKQPKGKGDRNVVTFDERELVVVLFEAAMGLSRPPGVSIADCHDLIDEGSPKLLAELKRMAHAAMGYVVEQLQDTKLERAQ